MAVIDSLVAKLSFDFDGKALDQFNKGMEDASKAVAIVAAGAVAAGAAIFAFTSKIAAQNDEIGKLGQKIGIAAQSINELGFVAQLNGGSINSMNSSLENLAKTASESARGLGAGVEAFGLLGVSAIDANGNIKQTDDLLLDVADAVSKLDSQSQKLELLSKLGIDSSLLLTLEQGSEAIRAQRKEVEELGFVLDKNATTRAAAFNDEMLRVKTVVNGVASAIGTKLMKQITPMVKTFLEWFKANKEIIKQNLNQFFEKLTTVIEALFNIGSRVVNVINTLVQAFGGWEIAIQSAGAALLVLNAKALLIPILIAAAAVAIFLLIEDIISFAQGADSQLGSLAKKFPIIGTAANGLISVFKRVAEGWRLIFTEGGAALDGLMLIIEDVGKSIFNALITPINTVISLLNKIPGIDIGEIKTAKQSGALDSLTDGVIGKVGEEGTSSLFESASDFFGGLFSSGATQQKPLVASAIGNTNQISNNTSNSTNNTVTINIEGGDINKIKRVVSEALGAEMKASEMNLATQVSY